MRRKCRNICKSQWMFWLIVTLVFLNTCVLATEHHHQPPWLDDFQVRRKQSSPTAGESSEWRPLIGQDPSIRYTVKWLDVSGVHKPLLRLPLYLWNVTEDVRPGSVRVHGLSVQQVRQPSLWWIIKISVGVFRFDFIVVISSILEFILVSQEIMPPLGMSVLRCIRLLRAFKVTR